MIEKLKTYDETIQYLMDFTNYEKVVNFPYDATKLDLRRMRGLLTYLDEPHLATKSIHITGTKGKGSTALMCAALIERFGLNAGLFSSPHLVEMEERISINGAPISHSELVEEMNVILPYLEERKREKRHLATPTYFEIFTALAWDYFRRKAVDIAVMEVGLGGRLDSTNIIAPEVCIITNVTLDHARQLGGTIESIAREKAGIIKPGVPIITASRDPVALGVFKEFSEKCGSDLYRLGVEFTIDEEGHEFSVGFDGSCFGTFSLTVLGRHQHENAACAVVAAELLKKSGLINFTDEAPVEAINSLSLPGRCQVIRQHPLIVNDGAHNASSLLSTLATIRDYLRPESLALVFAAGVDKDIGGMIREIKAIARDVRLEQIVFTTTHCPRSCPSEKLKDALGPDIGVSVGTNDNIGEIWAAALSGELGGAVCFTGSMYLAGRVQALAASR